MIQENLLSRQEALQLWTIATTWFSNEKERGELKEGYCADFAVLSDDYFSIDDEKIKDITSLLTVVDGNIVHGSGRFSSHAPKLPEPLPEWSPVRFYGGYQSVR